MNNEIPLYPASSPDKELWNRFQGGENDALSVIYSSYFGQLYNYGFKFTTDITLVEDCIQDLFIKLMRNRQNLSAPDSVKGYLFAALRFHLFDKLKQNKKIVLNEINDSADFHAELQSDPALILNEEEKGKQQKLQHAISALTPRQREAIFLKYQEGLSYPEIASMLDLTQKATYKLIGRAIQTLRSVAVLLFIILWFW